MIPGPISNCRLKGEKIEPVCKKPFDLGASGVENDEWWALLDNFRTAEWPRAETLEVFCKQRLGWR